MSSTTSAAAVSSPSASRTPAFARTHSVRSAAKSQLPAHGEGYAADNDNDDDEEGDYDGEDGDEDDEDVTVGEGGFGGQEMLDETTIKSGYLWKRGEKRKNWKKRWFVLRSSKLCYYKNDKEYQLLRFIDLADVHTVAAIALKKNENSFGIVTSKRQYYVRAANAKEMQIWIDAMNDAREQLRQRTTLTRNMAGMEVGASGGEEGPVGSPRKRGSSVNATLSPQMDRQHSMKGSVNNNASSQPINIVIPGKGLYTSPAQARQNSTGTSVTSPLTATSDSEQGGAAGGAEQFGLSYASSAGQSLGSSPGRAGFIHHQLDQNSTGGRQSPTQSGGDDPYESLRRSKTTKKSSTAIRDISAGSSGGEGSANMKTGWTAAGGKAPASQSKEQQGALLSSSDEDGEGEDWDEDEVADRAMPLPGSTGLSSTLAGTTTPQWTVSAPITPSASSSSKPKVDSDFFKNTSKVIHQGYLMKQSNRRKHWRKRYFVLTSAHLSYTRSHMNEKPSRQIPLSSILDAIEYTSKNIQMPGNQSTSTPLASPSIQSPPMPISFQLGSNNQDAGNSSVVPGKDSAPLSGEQTNEQKGGSAAASHPAVTPKKRQENCFKIITPKRTYVVCAPTEEEEIKWLSALQALLAHWRVVKGTEKDTSTTANTSTNQQPPSNSGTNPNTNAPRPLQRNPDDVS